eukprot:5113081-Amphidinium_carterae.1
MTRSSSRIISPKLAQWAARAQFLGSKKIVPKKTSYKASRDDSVYTTFGARLMKHRPPNLPLYLTYDNS